MCVHFQTKATQLSVGCSPVHFKDIRLVKIFYWYYNVKFKHIPGNILVRIQNNLKGQVIMSIEIELELPLLNKPHNFRNELLYTYIF